MNELKKQITEKIYKYEIQKKTLNSIALHPKSSKKDIEKCEAVIRFIGGFINDLKELSNI